MAVRNRPTRTTPVASPPFHFFVLPVLLVNFLNEARQRLPVADAAHVRGSWSLAAALLVLGVPVAIQALTVQDRVIRLEDRLRLRQILPPDLQSHVDELTHRQLVALRFASDAELPDSCARSRWQARDRQRRSSCA